MVCKCGCNEVTAGGLFKPGHDQRLRSRIEGDVGGILNLQSLVETAKRFGNDEISSKELTETIKNILNNR